MRMELQRLKHLQALLAHYGAGWNWDSNPVLNTPVDLPGNPVAQRAEIPSAIPPASSVAFKMQRGRIVTGDILRPDPGRWIEAEGHIIRAQVYDGKHWINYEASEGQKV